VGPNDWRSKPERLGLGLDPNAESPIQLSNPGSRPSGTYTIQMIAQYRCSVGTSRSGGSTAHSAVQLS
jgi:hypothetical protein